MKIVHVVLCAAIAASALSQDPPPAPQNAQYTNEYIGVSLSHPASWKVTPKKTDSWITIPLKDGTSVAALNLVAAQFHADVEIWQKSQEAINKQMEMEIVRQWSEEILGVPLLLTKVRSAPGKLASAIKAVPGIPADQPLVTLIGLVYSATPRKLMFRLTATESNFEEAEFLFRQTLETLRTNDGKLPTAEDPGRKPEPIPEPGKKPAAPPTKTTIGANGTSAPPAAPLRAPKSFATTAAARKVAFYFPEGWSVDAAEGGNLKFKSEDGSTVFDLTINSTLDSEPPFRAFLRAQSESLKAFDTVGSRDENLPKKNRAGAQMARLWRTGQGASGVVSSFDAIAGSIDFYVVLRWRGAGPIDAAIKKRVEAMLEQISVEPIV